MAEGLLLQLQQNKAQTVKISGGLKETLVNVLKHANSIRLVRTKQQISRRDIFTSLVVLSV